MYTLMLDPNPKQAEFFGASSRFVAYGGARGGGKSWAVRQKAVLMALHYPGIRLLLVRRTYPELRENHVLPLLGSLKEIVKYKDSEKAFVFHNGSRLRFGYCDNEADVLQYQGQEFDVIFMDEATQFTEFQFQTITACLRGTNDFPKRFYLTCNPGGVGHAWVKRLFIDREYKQSERAQDYTFIAAGVRDNQILMKKNPEYIRQLQNLPAELRRAWLDGDWGVMAGQYFPEFREETHVVAPFTIPVGWRRYFAMDYGLDMLAGYWIAMSPKEEAYVYREVFEPDLIISRAAEYILRENGGDVVDVWLAPPDLWNRRQDTGRSVADIFAEKGIVLTKADNRRVQGWLDLKEWMSTEPNNTPALKIFPCCTNLIRSFPALLVSSKDPNDCATEPHIYTHGPDAIRYFAAGRPVPAKIAGLEKNFEGELQSFLQYGG